MFAGTAEEYQAHQAKARVLAQKLADVMNELQELTGTVALANGRLITDGATIVKSGRGWEVRTR